MRDQPAEFIRQKCFSDVCSQNGTKQSEEEDKKFKTGIIAKIDGSNTDRSDPKNKDHGGDTIEDKSFEDIFKRLLLCLRMERNHLSPTGFYNDMIKSKDDEDCSSDVGHIFFRGWVIEKLK